MARLSPAIDNKRRIFGLAPPAVDARDRRGHGAEMAPLWFQRVWPPSTGTMAPVTKLARGLSSHAAMAPISSG